MTEERTREQFLSWLGTRKFDRFVTLATNDSTLANCKDRMRDLLREWDARVNRSVVGKPWLKRPDECMFGCFVQEKVGINPHWHGMISFGFESDPKTISKIIKFDNIAGAIWRKFAQVVP